MLSIFKKILVFFFVFARDPLESKSGTQSKSKGRNNNEGAWSEKHTWLRWRFEGNEKKMMCITCIDASKIKPNVAVKNSFVNGSSSGKHDTIVRHEKSTNHVQAIAIMAAKNKPYEAPASKMIVQLNQSVVEKLSLLFRNAHAVAVQGRPISDYVWMANLDKKKGLDVGETYLTPKYANTFQEAIADYERDIISSQVRSAKFLSPLLDGSTDSAIIEQELFYVRFSSAGSIHTKFIGVMSVDRGTADNIYKAFKDCVERYLGISWDDFKYKVIALGSDGAAVMTGAENGFYGLLKREVPHVVSIHCMAHRLELSFKECLKSGLSEKIVSGFLVTLYYFYKNSTLNRSLLKTSFAACGMKPRIPTRVGGTRWVGHVFRALQQWQIGYPAIVQQLQVYIFLILNPYLL